MFRVVSPPIIRSAYTVSTASGTCQTVLLPVAIVEELELLQVPDPVDAVVCAPDDGWRCHPKYVEQFPE